MSEVTSTLPPSSGFPPVSLALATYNQAELLRRFLANYLRHGAARVQLTIVDDGSDDDTPRVLEEIPSGAPVFRHRLPHVSAAHARNHALRHSPTPWLAFSDTDCQLDAAYFATLATIPARFPGAPAVEGAVEYPAGPKPPFTHSLSNQGGSFATANMVFHVTSVLPLGGFDEGFTVNFREDTDLGLTILDKLGPIPFCPDLKVVHPHVERDFLKSLRRAMATQDRLVRAEMRLFQKHPGSYGRVRHFPDAYGTVRNWCWKYSALYARECRNYLFHAQGLSLAERLRGWRLALQALVVAGFEQGCVIAVYAREAGALAKLRAR